MSEDAKPIAPCAPYGPFSTFDTALNYLATLKGIPPKIDRSVFPSMGGDAKTHTLNTFKFFKLVDADGTPQPLLSELAFKKEGRKEVMRRLIKESYPNVSEEELATMTIPQLDSKLGDKAYNVSGGTKQKARSFLLKAAEFAGVPLSNLLTAKGPKGPRGQRKKRTQENGEVRPVVFKKTDTKKTDANGCDGKHEDTQRNADAMPITLAPGKIAYLELPNGWIPEKDAKKLLSLLALTLDVDVQVS